MSNKTIQSLRGMKDIVNEESTLFTYFVENASKIAKNYGFSYITFLFLPGNPGHLFNIVFQYTHDLLSPRRFRTFPATCSS